MGGFYQGMLSFLIGLRKLNFSNLFAQMRTLLGPTMLAHAPKPKKGGAKKGGNNANRVEDCGPFGDSCVRRPLCLAAWGVCSDAIACRVHAAGSVLLERSPSACSCWFIANARLSLAY